MSHRFSRTTRIRILIVYRRDSARSALLCDVRSASLRARSVSRCRFVVHAQECRCQPPGTHHCTSRHRVEHASRAASVSGRLRLNLSQPDGHSQCVRANCTRSQRNSLAALRTLPQRQSFHLSCLWKRSLELFVVVGFEQVELPPRWFSRERSKNKSEVL